MTQKRKKPRLRRAGDVADDRVLEELRNVGQGWLNAPGWIPTADLWSRMRGQVCYSKSTFRKQLNRLHEKGLVRRRDICGYFWKIRDHNLEEERRKYEAVMVDRLRGWGLDPENFSIGYHSTSIRNDAIVPRPDALQ